MRRRDVLKGLFAAVVATPLLSSDRSALTLRPAWVWIFEGRISAARASVHAPVSKGEVEVGYVDDRGSFITLHETSPGHWEGYVPAGSKGVVLRRVRSAAAVVDFIRGSLTGVYY